MPQVLKNIVQLAGIEYSFTPTGGVADEKISEVVSFHLKGHE